VHIGDLAVVPGDATDYGQDIGRAVLAELTFSDGTPFADEMTRDWLAEEVGAAAAGSADGAPAASGDGEVGEALAEAKKAAADGNLAEAIRLLHKRAAAGTTGETRFRIRVGLARLCARSGQADMARAMFEALDVEIEKRGLEEWSPGLAAECLEGHIACLRALAREGKQTGKTQGLLYARLCRLNPEAALRLSS